MNFYGVGTRFGGTDCFLFDCIKYDFWCMGDEERKYTDLYNSIKPGDMLIAKKYYTENEKAVMEVEAIGIVKSLELSKNVPEQYKTSEKYGVSVVWIKYFDEPLKFTSETYVLGGTKPRTIFSFAYCQDKIIIDKVLDSLKCTVRRAQV